MPLIARPRHNSINGPGRACSRSRCRPHRFLPLRDLFNLTQCLRGKSLVVGNVNEYVLKPILRKLELPYGTTHAMRHGAVSRSQEAGVHGDLITKWVGHTSLKMTSKYTHFSAKHRKEVVAKLGAIAS